MERERTPLSSALDILSRRDHSEAELARKLRRKGFGEEEVEGAVGRLRELGYLDDRRIAGRLAETAVASGRMVGERLRGDLTRRGITRAIAEEALAAASAGHDERSAVTELLGRKFPGFDPGSADPKQKRRIVGWFQRRGYSLAAVLAAMRVSVEE